MNAYRPRARAAAGDDPGRAPRSALRPDMTLIRPGPRTIAYYLGPPRQWAHADVAVTGVFARRLSPVSPYAYVECTVEPGVSTRDRTARSRTPWAGLVRPRKLVPVVA
jgi:hypothetical protein